MSGIFGFRAPDQPIDPADNGRKSPAAIGHERPADIGHERPAAKDGMRDP